MTIINLTPHALAVHHPDGVLTVPPSGGVARVATSDTPRHPVTVDGVSIPVVTTEVGEVTDLPDPQDGVILVVSGFVASAAPRPDVFSPGALVRADDGRVVGCSGLRASI